MRISDWSSDVCSSDLDDVSIVMDRKNVGAPERDDAVYKHAPAVTEDRRNRQSAVGILSRQYGIVAVLDEQIGPRFELIVVNQLGVQGNKVRHFPEELGARQRDRKSTRLNSSH